MNHLTIHVLAIPVVSRIEVTYTNVEEPQEWLPSGMKISLAQITFLLAWVITPVCIGPLESGSAKICEVDWDWIWAHLNYFQWTYCTVNTSLCFQQHNKSRDRMNFNKLMLCYSCTSKKPGTMQLELLCIKRIDNLYFIINEFFCNSLIM